MVERNPGGEAPSWAMEPTAVTETVASRNGLHRFSKRVIGIATVAALAVPGAAIANKFMSNEGNHADDPQDMGYLSLDQISDTTFQGDCDEPAFEGADRRVILGNNAFASYDLSGTDSDIQNTIKNTLSRNLVGIATAERLMASSSQEVDFNSLHKEINDKLAVIGSNNDERTKACQTVLAKFAVDGQRVNVTAGKFTEVVPVYNADGSDNRQRVDFVEVDAKSLFGEDGGVKGIWTDIKYGQDAIVMTPEGRLFIVKNTGNEEGAATIDTNSNETVAVTEASSDISVSNSNESSSNSSAASSASQPSTPGSAGSSNGNSAPTGSQPSSSSTPDAPGDNNTPNITPTDVPGTPSSTPNSTPASTPNSTPSSSTPTTETPTTPPTTPPTTQPPETTAPPTTQPPVTTAPPTTAEQFYDLNYCDLDEPRNEGGFGVVEYRSHLTQAQRDALLADPMNKVNYTNLGDSNGDGQVICK